ncbi:ATP-dependent DNA helicase [Candidatus Woesearchaeota archaeon]|nr:ATP-dependent DNA helicase [Candidatus Woesearchaeota archaeon]
MDFDNLLFPHDKIREEQDKLILAINRVINNSSNLIVHAPTGLGKTAAALGPAVKKAIDEDYKVFFLTSRHTQHKIAAETLKKMSEKYGLDLKASSIIGKKWLCLQSNVNDLYTKEFSEFCRALKEDNKCIYYENFRKKNKLTPEAKIVIEKLPDIADTKEILEISREYNVCPYEISMELIKNSRVIITDYYYIFNPAIIDMLFKRADIELEKSIIIVDEAHNLPERVKNLMTQRLTTYMVRNAVKEAEKYKYNEIKKRLEEINEIMENYSTKIRNRTLDGEEQKRIVFDEQYIEKEEFIGEIKKIGDYTEIFDDFKNAGDEIREEQRQSYIGSIGDFLESWLGDDFGFTRIISLKESSKGHYVVLSYRCLDPGLITKDIIQRAHSVILMSGTLTPPEMYKELLGIEKSEELVLKSPFPEKNRMNLIVPKTTTRYKKRNPEQFREIALVLKDIIDEIPGNCAVFFPSYKLRDAVLMDFRDKTGKSVFVEKSLMNKDEKQEFLDRFKSYSKTGAVLMGVISGSFGEGIDLPGDYLRAVIIIGLPLKKPDLEAKALIDYYDKKFGRGWDYGYLYPAFTKAIQAAGRCIRTEKDKGIIVFLDERYGWEKYMSCFPPVWNMKVSLLYKKRINEFFKENKSLDDF